ncbi:hypothetical protein E9549_04215 [Blastococcus sp. MG754426]|nr:hypothetical protein [Blastococcus sp. MG754426]MCF6510325.1 hypothetical protein [Blastococcus sp. MG754427]
MWALTTVTALAPASWGTTYAVTTEWLPPDRPLRPVQAPLFPQVTAWCLGSCTALVVGLPAPLLDGRDTWGDLVSRCGQSDLPGPMPLDRSTGSLPTVIRCGRCCSDRWRCSTTRAPR